MSLRTDELYAKMQALATDYIAAARADGLPLTIGEAAAVRAFAKWVRPGWLLQAIGEAG